MPSHQFESGPYGFSTLYGFDDNGPVDVLLHGYGNVVGATGSAVTVVGGDGYDTVSLGLNFTSNINLGGYGNSIDAGFGDNGTISAGSGHETVTAFYYSGYTIDAGGYNNTITEQGGAGIIQAGSGAETVTVGGGSGFVTADGYNNTVTVGQGAYTVNAGAEATINASTIGNSTLNATGYNNSFLLTGPGAAVGTYYDVVNAGQGDDSVTLDGGAATISLGGYNNAVSVTNGFAMIYNGAGAGIFTIGDQATVAIAGFQASDQLVIKAGDGIGAAPDVLSHLTAVTGGTELALGGGSKVEFYNTEPSQLQVSNFKVV